MSVVIDGQGLLFNSLVDIDVVVRQIRDAEAEVKRCRGVVGTKEKKLQATKAHGELQDAQAALSDARAVLAELRRDLRDGCMNRVPDDAAEVPA